jgi:hypothetical protein
MQPHWPQPAIALQEATDWVHGLLVPRTWEASHKKLFALKTDGDVATMKAHAYHTLTSSGLLAIVASWPRDTDADPSNNKIRAFVSAYTQAYRTLTRPVLYPQVGNMLGVENGVCMYMN